MVFWLLAIAVTATACAALYYASARGAVNAGVGSGPEGHFRLALAGIEADLASGKIAAPDAMAAKGELARELLRYEAEARAGPQAGPGRAALVAGIGAMAAIAFGTYALLGSPGLPALPLAERPEIAARGIDLGEAVARIEARLAADPDDLRGWSVLAPAYMQAGRHADAERAYRRVLELAGPSAEAETDLAEVLIVMNGGAAPPEAMELLESAAAREPGHQRSRFYIAGELTRLGEFEVAAAAWEELIGLASGEEPWLATARQGLDFARREGIAPDPAVEREAIAAMVSGLATRLESEGGTVDEWMRLVRSYIVLGETEAAQSAYDLAVSAYPQAFDRGELDTLALGAGLTLEGAAP